uniref:Uncharacterized protein LOC104265813 n=1 Tax=Phallusia mammillata TaxID=59560 RepID=A0A6F9DJQ0_9ASCI|nr:uncharacterized protein LOC104265813 [Phallusia mammillata]
MNSSVDIVINLVRDTLHEIPENDLEKICKEFSDNKIDSSALKCVNNFDTLTKILPGVPFGHTLKLFGAIREFNTSKDEFCESDDTLPVTSDDSFSFISTSTPNSIPTVISEDCSDSLSIGNESELAGPSFENATHPIPNSFPIKSCQFGYHAKMLINTGSLTDKGKREITSEMIRVMKNYESHPGRLLRRAAVSALVTLGKASLGLSDEEAKIFWLHKITQKLNTQLKQIRKSQKEKKPSKRVSNNLSGLANTSVAKCRKVSNTFESHMEENSLMEQHQMNLKQEFMKPIILRNKQKISELMAQTFYFRQKYIADNKPTPQTMTKEWPAISTFNELLREMNRIQQINPTLDKLQTNGEILFDKVIAYVQKVQTGSKLKRILKQISIEDNITNQDWKLVIGLWLLTNLLPNKTKKHFGLERYLLDLYPTNTTYEDVKNELPDRHQPVLILFGTLVKIQKICLMSEKNIVMQVDSIVQGVVALLSYYYAINYEYCPHVCKALQFVQYFWLEIKKPPIVDSVKELAMKLEF